MLCLQLTVFAISSAPTWTLSVIGVGSAMRLADRPPPGVVMHVFS